jgi:hypothetical protein
MDREEVRIEKKSDERKERSEAKCSQAERSEVSWGEEDNESYKVEREYQIHTRGMVTVTMLQRMNGDSVEVEDSDYASTTNGDYVAAVSGDYVDRWTVTMQERGTVTMQERGTVTVQDRCTVTIRLRRTVTMQQWTSVTMRLRRRWLCVSQTESLCPESLRWVTVSQTVPSRSAMDRIVTDVHCRIVTVYSLGLILLQVALRTALSLFSSW